MIMIMIKHLQMNPVSALNNPQGVDMPFSEIKQSNKLHRSEYLDFYFSFTLIQRYNYGTQSEDRTHYSPIIGLRELYNSNVPLVNCDTKPEI